jgi:phage baseplate assembly protein W
MLRSFGSRLTTLLFENMQEEFFDVVADEIKKAIEIWDNRVTINSINFDAKSDENSVDIKMSFAVRGFDNIFTYSTQLQGVQ